MKAKTKSVSKQTDGAHGVTRPTTEARVMQAGELRTVAHGLCRPSPTQPRITFARMDELVASVKDAGIRERLLVRAHPPEYTLHEPNLIHDNWIVQDKAGREQSFTSENEATLLTGGEAGFKPWFELVDGERRWRAAGLAGLTEVPVEMRDMTDAEVIEYQLMSFAQKEGLNEIEEGAVFRKLIDGGEHTVESLVLKTGKSRSHIFGRMALAKLDGPVREAFQKGEIEASMAAVLCKVPGVKQQAKLLAAVKKGEWDRTTGQEEPLSVRAAQAMIARDYMQDLKEARFKLDDAGLLAEAGACQDCPYRTGNQPDSGVKNPNVCTNTGCFHQKQSAHNQRTLDKAALAGTKVLTVKESAKVFSSYGGLEYNSGYVPADEVCHIDPKRRTFRQLVKASKGYATQQLLTMGLDHKGKPQELFPKPGVLKLLEEEGHKWAKPEPAKKQVTTEDREKSAAEKELRTKFAETVLLPRLLQATRGKTNSLDEMATFFRLLITIRVKSCYHSELGDTVNLQLAKPEKMTLDDLKCLFLTAFLTDSEMGDGLVAYDGSYGEALPAVCEWAGLDMKAMEKEFRSPALPGEKFEKAAGKTKAKPAKKGNKK